MRPTSPNQLPNQRGDVCAPAHRNELLIFILVTFTFSWAFWAPILAGIVERDSVGGLLLTLAGAFGPAVGAALTTRVAGRSVRAWFVQLWRWRIAPRWFAIALLLPPVMLGVAAVVHVALGRATFGIGPEVALYGYPLSVISIALLGGGQEEWGWRGFALPVLRRQHGPLQSSVVIAVIWGIWHVPLFLIPGTNQESLPTLLYVPGLLGASVLLTWIYEHSGGSIIPAMLLHAGFNAVAYYPAGGFTVAITPLGYGLIIGAYGMVAVAVAIWSLRRREVQNDAPETKTPRIGDVRRIG